MRHRLLAAALAPALALTAAAHAQVARIGPPTAPISRAVSVPAGAVTVYVSGLVAQPADPTKPTELGDTRTQATSIFRQMEAALKTQGYTLGDVVMMRVYLAPDPAKGGRMDYEGMMEAYRQAFGTPEQPNKPARVTVQVAGLVGPTMLAEIEAQAAKVPVTRAK